ncbi:MAG: IPTL-CTERM sorting domain-containing protein [Uliginosibacterium sp.]|nr:IPTL-CTERM sorting domain-containing protein [Uliginosibacterium sp.]
MHRSPLRLPTPQSVPTLGEWGMIGLAGLLALLGARRLRRV